MASLDLTFKDLYTRVSRQIGTGLTPTGQALQDAKDIVNRAYRRFLFPVVTIGASPRLWKWSFLNKSALFRVLSGTTTYAMPLDYGSMVTPFTYTLADSKLITSLKNVDEVSMLRMQSFNAGTGEPLYYCIKESPYVGNEERHHEVLMYPISNGDYTFAYTYELSPPKMVNDNDSPIGGVECAEALMQMCMAVAEEQEDGVAGVQGAKATELLFAAVKADAERNASDTVGQNNDCSQNDLYRFPKNFTTGIGLVSGYTVYGNHINT